MTNKEFDSVMIEEQFEKCKALLSMNGLFAPTFYYFFHIPHKINYKEKT